MRVSIDFTEVYGEALAKVLPGAYLLRVMHAEVTRPSKGVKGILVTFRIVGTQDIVLYQLELIKGKLWSLYTMLISMGIPTPMKKVSLNVQDIVGRECVAMIGDEETTDPAGRKMSMSGVKAFLMKEEAKRVQVINGEYQDEEIGVEGIESVDDLIKRLEEEIEED